VRSRDSRTPLLRSLGMLARSKRLALSDVTIQSRQTGAASLDGGPTVFSSYEAEIFVEWSAWKRLLAILQSNGGSYGLSGPRGAGKTWLMRHAVDWVRNAEGVGRLGGIGLWYPSPSEGDSLAFLSSLSDRFGDEIERWYRNNRRVRRLRRLYTCILACLVLAVVVGPSVAVGVSVGVLAGILLGLGSTVVAASLMAMLVPRWLRPFRPEARLAFEAETVREAARYTVTLRRSSELAAEGGRGLTARIGSRRERELVERPATLSSLINDFRRLAAKAGDVAGRVVIAIDELDKIDDPDEFRGLLRDIKGIFDVPRVHFLVSVSDEALRRLSVGALVGRDEFNSSFYTVIDAKPGTPEELVELFDRRTGPVVPRDIVPRDDVPREIVPREIALALAVLSGGNPREVVRLVELATSGGATTAADAIIATLRDEALSLRRDIVTAPDTQGVPGLGAESRKGAFASLPDPAFDDARRLSTLAKAALSPQMWSPDWQDEGFRIRFGEPWRRLMIRLAVAGQLLASPSLVRDRELAQRRDVVDAASQSAEIARVLFEGDLRVETRRPVRDSRQAREQLNDIGRQYKDGRKGAPGKARTARLDAIVAEARTIARTAGLTTAEIRDKLGSPDEGDRVVALAAVQATADPEVFEPLLSMATHPKTPFEGYHALLAIESLLPSLDAVQQTRICESLDQRFKDRIGNDRSRAALADRVLRSIAREREDQIASRDAATFSPSA
jgi:hypothetical protein